MNQQNANHIENIAMDLRLLDPLSVVDENFDDRQHVEWLRDDIGDVDDVLEGDVTLTDGERQELLSLGTDMRLDLLYARHGGQALGYAERIEKIDEADKFLQSSLKHARAYAAVDPVPYWDARSKMLDLQAFRAFNNAREAKTTLMDTEEGEKLWKLAETQFKAVILDSTDLMLELEPFFRDRNRFTTKAAGVVYEVALADYGRLKIYNNGQLDRTFFRGSLGREDRPKEEQIGKSAAHDFVIHGLHKTFVKQAKNGKNKQEYKPEVEVVYADTQALMPNILKVAEDFQIVVGEHAGKEDRNAAYQRLKELFDSQMAGLDAA